MRGGQNGDRIQRGALSKGRGSTYSLFYARYAVSYRDLEEILAERGVTVDHATLNRWVVKFSPLIAANA